MYSGKEPCWGSTRSKKNGETARVRVDDHSALLAPARGYVYAARVVTADGRQGPLTEIVIRTASAWPDLTLFPLDDACKETAIRPGDKVRFKATIANSGDGETPQPSQGPVQLWNSSVALTFSVDGAVVGWNANDGQRPMKPGETLTLESSAGSDDGQWTATPGTHMLLVEADDINRISTERFKWNNLRARSVTVGDNPGRLSLETDSTPGSVAFDADAVKDWAVFGCWNGQGKTERKQNINRIGNPTACGSGYVGIQPYCGTELCRTEENGTYRTRTGLWTNGTGNGFTLEVPAGQTEQTLTLFTGLTGGGHGELMVELTDGSAPAIVDRTWNANRGNGPWAPIPDDVNARYRIRFRSDAEDAKLRITWKLIGDPNRFRAQLRLQGAILE